MFIIVCKKGRNSECFSINAANYNYFAVFKNHNKTFSVSAGKNAKEFISDDEGGNDSIVIGVYPKEDTANQVFDDLMKAMLDGEKGFQMP